MTRENMARGLSVATTVAVVAVVTAFAVIQQRESGEARATVLMADDRVTMIPQEVPDTLSALRAQGQATYDELGCAACHSIAGEGSPRYPLDGVGSRLSQEEIRLWITDPQEIRPGVRKPAYDDLEPHDLRGLVVYMQSLTEPG